MVKNYYYVAHTDGKRRPVVVSAPRNVAPVKENFPRFAFMTGPFKTYNDAECWRRWSITY